jgi:DNA-binding FadR family transcriptional regulator
LKLKKIIENTNLTETLVREIIRTIVNGEYPEGASLPSEGEIAKVYGVSRTVVREAVQELARLGLVEKRQGRRSIVTGYQSWNLLDLNLMTIMLGNSEFGEKIFEDLMTVRLLLEGQSAATAAIRRTDEDIEMLRDKLEVLENFADKDDEGFLQADLDFHEAVFLVSRNWIANSILTRTRGLLWGSRYTFRDKPRPQMGFTRDFKELFDAIVNSSPEKAREAMIKHISRAVEVRGMVVTNHIVVEKNRI